MNGNRCNVLATALDETGAGVCTVEGPAPGGDAALELHIGDLLPGERAEVMLDHRSPHKPIGWGHVLRKLGEPSADRVASPCPAFGRCGGCVWQHLAYPAQLVEKQRRVAAALGDRAAIASLTPAPSPRGYRNKGKYVVGRDRGRVILGAYAPRTHEIIDTEGCRVVHPMVDELATWVRGGIEAYTVVPYDERRGTGDLRYVVIRVTSKGDALVVLVTTTAAPSGPLASLAESVGKHPAVRGVVRVNNDRRDGTLVPAGSTPMVLVGIDHVVEAIAGVDVRLGASEFAQVNDAQAGVMYGRVAELCEAGTSTTAVDLYAGLGGISYALARRGARVTAVEIDPVAVQRINDAAASAKLPIEAVVGDVGDVGGVGPGAIAPDAVVVNPPRKGLSAKARAAVIAYQAAVVVYVSCGPESLAKDLEALGGAGYRVETVECFDLMPGTAQIETIVKLRR